MSDTERWIVTYTKQINKKRAVYQDGFLEIQSSRRKILLYDEYDKLLDSRFLKTENVIRSGETLTFGSYLVDIGEKSGGHEPVTTSNCQGKYKNGDVGLEKLDRQEPKKNSISVDFKKSEMNKYGSSPTCLDMTKSSTTTKWQVLYTTQITQKKKKFHDGFLQLVDRHGALGRKVVLFDEYEKQLDSKFLKKEEYINSGERLAFESYLVDIGDNCGDHKHESTSHYQGMDKTVAGESGSLFSHKSQNNTIFVGTPSTYGKPTFGSNKAPVISPSQENIKDSSIREMHDNASPSCLDITKSSTIEWHVLYTTQITQMAKKFHDGVLQHLVRGGSQRGQVTLLAEDGTVLSHRHLKLSEDVRSGTTLDMPKYLIEVGQCRYDSSSLKDSKVITSSIDDTPLSRRVHTTVPFCNGKTKTKPSPRKLISLDDASSKNNVTNSSKRTPANEPKRSACDILSVLRRPIVQVNVEPMVEDSVELLVSDNHSDTRNHIHAKDCNSSPEDEFKERTSDHDCSMKTIKSEAVKILNAEKYAVYEFEEDLQENSSSFYLRSGATDSIKPVVNAECTDHFKLRLSSSTTEAHKLFTPAIDSVGQAAIASTLFTVSNVKVKLENTSEINSLPEIATETTGAVKVSSCISPKQHEDNKGNSSRCDKGATSIAGVASSDPTSHDYSDVEENILKQASLTKERDEFPSFDLGFEF